MEHNIDLIKQIREAYAKEEGYSSFAKMALSVNIVPRDITEIAKQYAEGMAVSLQARCDRYEKALKDNYAADFIDYIRDERNAITKEMLSDEWWLKIPASKRVVFENILIAYDQMVGRLAKLSTTIANEALSGEGKEVENA